MVTIDYKDENGINLVLDGILKSNLDFSKKKIRQDWDMFFLFDGSEGAGKSKFARQVGFYCDPTFKGKAALERIVFTPEEFKEAVHNSKPYQVIIWDEAFRGLSSRSALSKTNKMVNEMFMEMRQKNLFIFLILPSFFELDKYAAIHRSRILFHIYTGTDWKRGFFKFYDKHTKKMMYLKGKKLYDYCIKPSFFGQFNRFDPINEIEYNNKKKESLAKLLSSEEEDKESTRSIKYRKIIFLLINHLRGRSYKMSEISQIIQMEADSFRRYYSTLNKKMKDIGFSRVLKAERGLNDSSHLRGEGDLPSSVDIREENEKQ